MGSGETRAGRVTYQVVLTPVAWQALRAIADRRIQDQIRTRISSLAQAPEQQGKPLRAELWGFRSLRAAGQRYRIIYRVERQRVLVMVVLVGIRKEGDRSDVYRLAQRLLRLRLI